MPKVLERRLRIYEQHLGFDVNRASQWAFATTVLAILWPVEEGAGPEVGASFGAAARAMLHLLDSAFANEKPRLIAARWLSIALRRGVAAATAIHDF